MKRAHNFGELKIWQESMKLVKTIYLLNQELPNDERFGLISQMNRCSISIPSNIAGCSGRTSEKEFLHFLKISLSSSYELETQLILVEDLFKINVSNILNELNQLQLMLGGFIRKINGDLKS
jgi:four helix bundle protein